MNHENDAKEYLKQPSFAKEIVKDQEDEKRQSEQIDRFIEEVSHKLICSFNPERQNYFLNKVKEILINERTQSLKECERQIQLIHSKIEYIQRKTEEIV